MQLKFKNKDYKLVFFSIKALVLTASGQGRFCIFKSDSLFQAKVLRKITLLIFSKVELA